jgi:hypothetical protein
MRAQGKGDPKPRRRKQVRSNRSAQIPWQLLAWARDNRVLRLRWCGLEAEFAQTLAPPQAPARAWEPSSDLPEEERVRQIQEHERQEQERLLFHSA